MLSIIYKTCGNQLVIIVFYSSANLDRFTLKVLAQAVKFEFTNVVVKMSFDELCNVFR